MHLFARYKRDPVYVCFSNRTPGQITCQTYDRYFLNEIICIGAECNSDIFCFQPSHLHTHARIHTDDKPHKCPHCTMSFYTPFLLKKHSVVHTGERPYLCGICGQSFTRESTLPKNTNKLWFHHTPLALSSVYTSRHRHRHSPRQSLTLCLWLTARMGLEPILPFKLAVTIDIMLNCNGDCDSDGVGIGMCKQAFR